MDLFFRALVIVFVSGLSLAASVLDIFPETGVPFIAGKTACSFDYNPSGSEWVDGIDEETVFLASIRGDGWKLGIGKGGQVYSLRGPFGESVPPQRIESPWNDEVWQVVATAGKYIGPIHEYQNEHRDARKDTLPLMYFLHQSGIYTKGDGFDDGMVSRPFYSPCLGKRWNPETRTLELVNWMQQARTPNVWKSEALIFSAYRDVGDGVIEVNQVLHNFGAEPLTFLNTPWGGVRKSSMPQTVISNPDHSWSRIEGLYGWQKMPRRTVNETGGWMAWTKNAEKPDSPSLALVFGNDQDGGGVVRWGTSGNKARDYEVLERVSHTTVSEGASVSIRWYLVAGEFSGVCKKAAELAVKSGVSALTFGASPRQSVWIKNKTAATSGEGKPEMVLLTLPEKGTVPVFLLEDRRSGELVVTTDIYALADTEPFLNPLPPGHESHAIYDNRVIYHQYAEHIEYKNLLGFAFERKPEGAAVQQIILPEKSGVRLMSRTGELWVSGVK